MKRSPSTETAAGYSAPWSGRWQQLTVAATLLAAAVGGFWLVTRQAGNRYLAANGPAEWIVYPTAFNPFMYPASAQTTVFRRSIHLEEAAGPALLTVRGYHHVAVEVNGRAVPLPQPETNWTRQIEIDIGSYLQAGDNRLVAEVSNDLGPPALWLVLAVGSERLVSDASWESSLVGAVWQPARPDSQPPELRPGNFSAGGERSVDSLRARSGTLFLFAVLAAAAVLGRKQILRLAAAVAPRIAPRLPALALVVVVWLFLFAFNWGSLPFDIGFDAKPHLDYVRYIQERGAIPLANEGAEMQQPPFYYLASAGLLGVFGVAADGGPGGVFLLRAFGFLVGLIGVYLVCRGLGRLFPDRPAPQAVGVLLAACLPMHLYLAHYLSNDLLAGTLGTAAVYMTLVVLQDRSATARWLVGLGAVLGAGVLTKLTVVPVAAVVLTTLAATAVVRDRSLRSLVRNAGIPLAICLLVCGWYFVRNVQHFGRPVVGTHDPASGFRWWQDPGFASAGQFRRFGRALTDPYLAASAGFPDGLYSTCWGDGGWCGGGRAAQTRTPWNYELMAAGYLLALVPTACFAVGWVARFAEWVRRPSAVWGLLLALPAAALLSLVYHYVRYPFYCHIKAFYALPAVFAACAFVAHGFDFLTRCRGAGIWASYALGVALGTWGLTAFTSFVVDPSSADTLTWMGLQKLTGRDIPAAIAYANRAVAADPDHPAARTLLGKLLLNADRPADAVDQYRRAVNARPDDRDARLGLCLALCRTRDLQKAMPELAEMIRRNPDCGEPYLLLAALAAENDPAEAVRVAREGLRLSPTNSALHATLARSLLRLNETADAVRHYQYALQYDPESVSAVVGLAWVRAAHEDGRFRDAAEALELANRACQLTRRQWPPSFRLLAAALAEAGQYLQAAEEMERLLSGVSPFGDAAMADQLKRERELYKAGKPVRETAQTLSGR